MFSVAPHRIAIRARLLDAFSASLPLAAETEPHLRGALLQTLQCPGSMVRAQLVYDMAGAYGLAVAVEYFHTASLVFDDLPCLDDATQRRGEPCIHRSHGEAAAVLAALGLVNRAYALLWSGVAGSTPAQQSAAGDYVEKCLGVEGVLNGQSHDLHYASRTGNRPSPQQIATGKTVSPMRWRVGSVQAWASAWVKISATFRRYSSLPPRCCFSRRGCGTFFAAASAKF